MRLVEELSGIIVAIWAVPIETAVHVAHTHVSLIVHGQFFCSHFYLDDNIEMLAKKLSRDPFFIHTHTYTCTHTSPHTHTHTTHLTHAHTTLQDSLDQAGQLQKDKDELLKQVVTLQEQLETLSKEKEKLSKQVCWSCQPYQGEFICPLLLPYLHRFPTLRGV